MDKEDIVKRDRARVEILNRSECFIKSFNETYKTNFDLKVNYDEDKDGYWRHDVIEISSHWKDGMIHVHHKQIGTMGDALSCLEEFKILLKHYYDKGIQGYHELMERDNYCPKLDELNYTEPLEVIKDWCYISK